MTKSQQTVRVPKDYYRHVHETRYRNILGAGALFRQERMNPWVAEAWEAFRAATDIPCGALGIEFGCGTGINSIIISLQGFQMIGLDISATATRRAAWLGEARGSRAQFLVGDMFCPPLAAETFDFAVNIWSLHVVGEQHLRDQHLRECRRILRPGGYLFLHNESSEEDVLVHGQEIVIKETAEWNIPEHSNWFDLPDGGKIQVSFPGHMPPGLSGRRSLREHRQELERAGFDVLRCYAEIMRPDPAIPGNRVMVAFAQKPG